MMSSSARSSWQKSEHFSDTENKDTIITYGIYSVAEEPKQPELFGDSEPAEIIFFSDSQIGGWQDE